MKGKAYLITPPADAVVTLAEVKTILGITDTASDDLLTAMIGAATSQLDAASSGWLGRALRPQTWELRMSRFPSAPIRLPYPPVTEVVSVKYDDADGNEQTLVLDADYRVLGLGDAWRTVVRPVYNGSWPAARDDDESVRIRYVAGYGGSPDPMPGSIKTAIALMAQHLRTTSEGVRSETTVDLDSVTYADPAGGAFDVINAAYLAPLRVYRF